MMEQADIQDLKSCPRNRVWVRIPLATLSYWIVAQWQSNRLLTDGL